MSYASVAKHDAPPPSQQPHPNPALLNTTHAQTNLPDVESKVNVVGRDFRTNPQTETSRSIVFDHSHEDDHHKNGSQKRKARREKAHAAEEEGIQIWNKAKNILFQPAVAGGLFSVVNVGLISSISYTLYIRPELRSDMKTISMSAVGLLSVLGAESYLAEEYLKTEAGQAEQKRAKEEGALIYKHAREIVLRPGFLGGMAGILNICLLGGVGYASYVHWDKPEWDRRIVSAVSVGLLALFGGEGYLAEKYNEGDLLKRR